MAAPVSTITSPFRPLYWIRFLTAALIAATVLCSTSRGDTIDCCGLVDESLGCLRFYPYTGDGWVSILPDTVHITYPGEYHISAVSELCIPPPCGSLPVDYCLYSVHVSSCEPEDLGCGVLHNDTEEECITWTPLASGDVFLLSGMQGYVSGDTVGASGIIDRRCGTWCVVTACLHDARLSACSPTPMVHLSWGRLKSGFRR